ncbi:Histidine kinase [Quadrisphaera granulorum]|uniref:histidine kinase n=1 Tax=Quadrisphaera granulorum TaxID=317664 RepID=A0A316ADL6_9ACTN|nr:histidine kinase [Quadrisphaera granulorum]PWJ55833.1 histidine kinase [Quadrisphaera granulorum]SZE95330.1 Histidine kinase [Quadrisphaera granulorum]
MSAVVDHLPVLGSAVVCAAGAALLLTGPGGAHDAPPADRRRVAVALLVAAGLLAVAGASLLPAATGAAAGPGPAAVVLACSVVLPSAVALVPLRTDAAMDRHRDAAVDRALVTAVLGSGAVTATGALSGTVLDVLGGGALVVALAALLWWRTERSREVERTRWLWLVAGVVTPVLAAGQVLFAVDGPPDAPLGASADGHWSVVAALAVLLGGAVAVAALVVGLRAPLVVDVRRLVAQLAGYAVSVEVALALFTLGQVVVRALTGAPPRKAGYALLAVGVAATFHPVALLVRWLFDELLFGGRRDPVAVMSNLGVQLRSESDPAAWVASLRADLGAARVELWDDVDLLAAAVRGEDGDGDDGERGRGTPVRVPLAVGGQPVGALVVVVDLPDEQAAGQLRRLLDLLAPPLARAMHGLALTRQLAVERAQALAALEEERRRLRRDLHDGLGPVLTGIAYSADAARNFVGTDPARADGLLAELREDVSGSIAEVRRLVVGLRPPALDERGLVGAVRQQVARLGAAHASSLDVEVVGEGLPPSLPAAVEVAAYRVAVEAVANAARHAREHPDRAGEGLRVRVGFAVMDGSLIITADDDGAPTPAWVAGVGTASMRERCEQLHGALDAGPTLGGGRVRAVLPLTPATP